MLKLKYLYNNEELAGMILRNWEFDEESLDMFQYYRISSNAIYPFQYQGKTQLLRFSPTTEKYHENILAELDYISYLRSKQYGVLEAVKAKNGEELIKIATPWGEYYASVFKRVTGVQIHKTDLSDIVIFNYGKALGKLHQLSNEYKPTMYKRWSYSDVLDWIKNILVEYPHEQLALEEAKLLQGYFDTIPVTNQNFGLIHYDFEYDNVFFDEESISCNVIDFDDSMYHWFVMDIEQALASLQDCVQPEMIKQNRKCFLDGYRTEYDIPENMESLIPACRRFANLYGYVRVLRSTTEKWDHEPEWLIGLRKNLSEAMKRDSLSFGMEIK